ncbi:MAG: FecR domain-containing protein [Holophagaceae bacterium]|nr:FecR domain-containing protein [Holophagaceae bacterium]
MFSFFGQTHAPRLVALLVPAAIICPAPAFAQEPDEYLGERPEQYAMVRHMEGNIRISKGGSFEELTTGTPIAEGDIIDSYGRGIIQFGDGSRMAFGERTRLEVATLFDDRDGSIQALFRLEQGRIRLLIGPQSGAYFRIDTPSGGITLESRCNASLEVGSDRSTRLKVFSGIVAFRNKVDVGSIRAGERLVIYSENDRLDRARTFNTYDQDAFEVWAERQITYTRSENSQYVPSEIRYYADTLDNLGEWVRVVDVGWCWRPRVTVAGWRPYWRGHWGAYRGGMTWVSYDPFGYVTHHYGRWGWSSGYGWYWIPGVYYSPAWVAWNVVDSFFGWAPLGYYNRPVYWGYNNWHHDLWNVVHIRNIHNRSLYNHTIWDRSVSSHFPSYQVGNRSLAPAWRQGPLIVTRQEFINPDANLFRRALSREVATQRIIAYERQAGRQLVIRRDVVPNSPNNPSGSRSVIGNRPFEDHSTRRVLIERPVTRVTPRPSGPTGGGSRTAPGNNTVRTPDRNTSPSDPRRNIDTTNRSVDMRDTRRGEAQSGQGRQTNTPPPSRPPETRTPSRSDAPPPSRPPETRPPSRSDAPPSRATDREATRESRQSSPSKAPSTTTPAPSRTSPPPSRNASPPARSNPPARTSPPPDRSRSVRR